MSQPPTSTTTADPAPQVTSLRAQADAIQPDIPEGAQDLIDAADRATVPEPDAVTGADRATVPEPDAVSGADRAAGPGSTGSVDTDRDGLSDDFERQLGTNVDNPDTDGDGWNDGIEVAQPFNNPRVKEAVDLDPLAAAEKDAANRAWESSQGLEHNEDADGDGVADWIERYGLKDIPNLTADTLKNNRSPIDEFVESALSQKGQPYRFGAEVDPAMDGGGEAYDSGELVEWAAKQAGLRDMPDGTWNQYQFLRKDGAIDVEEALATKGALVFGFSSDPAEGMPDSRYVAISVGNGKDVIEVSERTGEVKVVPHGGLYKYAAKIPALHTPEGDLDGDGFDDETEMAYGGDPSRSMTWSLETGANRVESTHPRTDDDQRTTDPTNPAHPTGTTGTTDPVNPANPVNPVPPAGTTLPIDPVNPVDPGAQHSGTDPTVTPDAGAGGTDPLGFDRYVDPTAPDNVPAGEPAPDAHGDIFDDATGAYTPRRDPGTSYDTDTGSHGPSSGDAYGATDCGWGSDDQDAGGAYTDVGASDSSYGDSGSGDAYDDSYSDASTYQ